MYKLFLSVLIILIAVTVVSAQKRGINNDPYSKGKGEKPYEMKGRKEAHTPLVTFDDCSKWVIETKNA